MTPPPPTLAFVESPIQLLNLLEWVHACAAEPTAGSEQPLDDAPPAPGSQWLKIVVLPPTDPMSRRQLRQVAALARDEGHAVCWQEARGGALTPVKAFVALSGHIRRARRIVIGDAFSRFTQLLLMPARTHDLVVLDDGTATMELIAQLGRGDRLRRWHRTGATGLGRVKELAFAPVANAARRRFTPRAHRVEIFTSMPVTALPGMVLRVNGFAWTRSRFGTPPLTEGTDLLGTSLVETGVVDPQHYFQAIRELVREHGAGRYFAHRRESAEKLRALGEATGMEIVRPDLPLELILRRGPVGRTVVSFPSTTVHTLPFVLRGTGATVVVHEIDPAWLTRTTSPRAHSFLADVTSTARDVRRPATSRGRAVRGPARRLDARAGSSTAVRVDRTGNA